MGTVVEHLPRQKQRGKWCNRNKGNGGLPDVRIRWKVAFYCVRTLRTPNQSDQWLLRYRLLNIGGGGENAVPFLLDRISSNLSHELLLLETWEWVRIEAGCEGYQPDGEGWGLVGAGLELATGTLFWPSRYA